MAALAGLFAIGLIALATVSEGGAEIRSPELVLDPNTARPEILTALPGLGHALVGRIVAARDREPFRSLDDLERRVKGIGPVTMRNLRPYLRIERTAAPGVDRMDPETR